LARYEFPKYGEEFQFPEAVFAAGDVGGFVDFLAGFPVDCVEMLVLIGEYSTKADDVTVMDGAGKAAAPVPKKFFEWPDTDRVMFNLTALPTKDVAKILAPNLEGEDKPEKAHWWFRYNLVDDIENPAKFPVPGEFVGLGVRMMPDKPWGKQKSSPFVWSGNWIQTVYLTSAVIKSIQEPTDDTPYSTYTVTWQNQEITGVRPSDFAEYREKDRVSILKDVSTDKVTQLWRDDDMEYFGGQEDMDPADITWQICPISFYGLEKTET